MSVIEFPGKSRVEVVRRDEAVEKVRGLLRFIGTMERAACLRMMELGDVLIPIRNAAGYGGWGAFLKDCGLPERDAQIAMQLAKARPAIEAENAKRASGSQLSVRAALKLIRPKRASRSRPKVQAAVITLDAVLGWLKTATAEDKRQVAVALAQDPATMRKILPAKAIPAPVLRLHRD